MDRDAVIVVLAGGVGSRLEDATPKQFLCIAGRPVLAWTLIRLPSAYRIVVVYNEMHLETTRAVVAQAGRRAEMVGGGRTRRESISAGLRALGRLADDTAVVIQNGASPNTPTGLMSRCLSELQQYDVVQAFFPATHTVIEVKEDELAKVLPRHNLGYTADPTVYRFSSLHRIVAAQRDESGEMTLDTAKALGMSIHLVPSPTTNIKLTTRADVLLLETFLRGS